MLWIAYQLFRDIISHYLLFRLKDSPCKSRGTEAEAEWTASKLTRSFQDDLSVGPYACSEHKPSCKQICCAVLEFLCRVHCWQGMGVLPGVWGNPYLTLYGALWAPSGSISLVTHTWHPCREAGVNWQWAGDDLVWVWPREPVQRWGWALSLLLLAQPRPFLRLGSRWCVLCSLRSFSARGCTWESYIICDSCSSK